MRDELLARGVNDEFSGGEKKRAETVQLAVLEPKFAVLDEIDSGLDVDALRDVARRVERMTNDDGLGVLAITHYARLLTELRPDRVHVLLAGRVVLSGGPELADRLEETRLRGHRGRGRRRRADRRDAGRAATCSPIRPTDVEPVRRPARLSPLTSWAGAASSGTARPRRAPSSNRSLSVVNVASTALPFSTLDDEEEAEALSFPARRRRRRRRVALRIVVVARRRRRRRASTTRNSRSWKSSTVCGCLVDDELQVLVEV